MPLLDELSPSTVRSQLITLAPANPLVIPQAGTAVDLTVTLTGDAAPGGAGLMLPLEFLVTSPSSGQRGVVFYRHIFRTVVPSRVTFTPREGGTHLAVLREVGHNLTWGALSIQIAGSSLLTSET